MLDLSNNKFTCKILVDCQMDIMNDQNFYANNCGLCGIQIRVLCPKDLSPTKPLVVELKETWFSWEGVKIRYAIDFFVVVGILHLTQYFVPVKPPTHHSKQKGKGYKFKISYKLCMHFMVKANIVKAFNQANNDDK